MDAGKGPRGVDGCCAMTLVMRVCLCGHFICALAVRTARDDATTVELGLEEHSNGAEVGDDR